MSLGTKLLASMSGEYATSSSGPLRDEDRLLEPSIFTTEERKRQKGWWKKACCGLSNRLPVCTDFYYERVRSRLAFVCIAIQIYFYLVIESSFVLSRLGFYPIPNCARTLMFIAFEFDSYHLPNNLESDLENYYFAYVVCKPIYLLLSSIALISWNSPVWTIVGAIMSAANLALYSLSNGQFCTALNDLIPQYGKFPNGFPFDVNNYPLEVVFLFGICQIILSSIVTLSLILLSMSAIKKKLLGGKLFEQEKTGFNQPVIGNNRLLLPESLSIEYAMIFAKDFIDKRLLAVPLRHVVASALTASVILALSSVIVVYIEAFYSINLQLWEISKSVVNNLAPFDPPPFPLNSPEFQEWLYEWVMSNGALTLLSIVMTKYSFQRDQVFGSLKDILTYAPYGIWIVAGCLISVIIYSFYPISHQHEILVKRYEGLQILKKNRRLKESNQTTKNEKINSSPVPATPHSTIDNDLSSSTKSPPDPLYHLAPDLRNAGHFSGFQYVVSHLLVHVAVFFISCILAAIVVLGIMIYCKGFQNILIVLLPALRAQIFTAVYKLLPIISDYVVLPLLNALSVDPVAFFAPFRVVYIFFAGFFKYSDGPFVFSPRIMLFIDTVWSFTLGLYLGILDAFMRLLISLFWGLFKTVVMWEPVVPVAFASIDLSYSAYCSMMKGAHIEFCDIEELGQEFPPITIKGAYESSANSVILKADAYGASVGDVAESEAEPLVVSA